MKHRREKKTGSKIKREAWPKPTEAVASLTAGRKWWFRLISLLVLPLVIVGLMAALLETGLRLGGYGYDTAFFRSIRIDGQEYFINNEKFSQRFFPSQLARWPDPFKIPAIKQADTVRIFILGESAAMGDPQPAYGASRYMETLLRDRYPGKHFEVVNLAITAINSHVILPIARECARHDGDYWIIYMGNNEMVGPYGAATVFGAQALPRRAAQLNLAIQETRTGQLLVAGLRHLSGKGKNTSWGGMEMFLNNQIAPGDPRKETVYRNFEGNLRDIVGAGVKAGAVVILNTVAVNLKDCPPFASLVSPSPSAAIAEQFDRLFATGKSLQDQGNFQAAAEQFTQAVQLEPQHAGAHYRLAQCDVALTNAAAAGEFQLACDLDALPFRADSRINDTIRKIAQANVHNRLVFCDAEKVLGQSAPGQIAGDETFYEHVHFNFDGNYRLGRLWAEQVGQRLTAAGTQPAGTHWDTQETCEQELGLSVWNREFVLQAVLRRMQTPPLSSQFNNSERMQKIWDEIRVLEQVEARPGMVGMVRAGLLAAVARSPGDVYLYEGLANFLEENHDQPGAIAAYRQAVEIMPDDFYDSLELGRLLGEAGQPEQGEPYLQLAIQLRPSLPEGWLDLGNVLTAEQKYAPALGCMERAAALRPQEASYVCLAAQLLGKLGRHAEAIAEYRRAIRLGPDDWQTHFELAGELVAANQAGDAIGEYQEVLKLDPSQVTSQINLGVVFVRFNRLDDAIACFQAALKLEPDNHTAQEYLASVLAHKGQGP